MDLNFPKYSFKIKRIGDKHQIYDPVRKRYFDLTPEEWVRQHAIEYLHQEKGISYQSMAVEKKVPNTSLRTDILIYNRNLNPSLIVECKAPSVKITQEVLDQLFVYFHYLPAQYMMVTNGIQHFYFQYENDKMKVIPDLPPLN